MRAIKFESSAFEEYISWSKLDKDIFKKINEIIFVIAREPFIGIGKPEPLKGNYKGYWSRRINLEHRIIYKVDDNTVFIAKCRGHYD